MSKYRDALNLTATHPGRAEQLAGIQKEITFRLDLANKATKTRDRDFQIAMADANVRSANDVAKMTCGPAEARALLGA